jgi:hypothetical protein
MTVSVVVLTSSGGLTVRVTIGAGRWRVGAAEVAAVAVDALGAADAVGVAALVALP